MSTGVPQCGDCSRTVVNDRATADGLFNDVIDWVESIFGKGMLRSVRYTFGSIKPTRGRDLNFGHTKFVHVNGVTDLHIETMANLPAQALAGILAHEIGHVLLYVDDKTLDPNPVWPDDDLESEGFCEVVRSLWLEHRGDKFSRALRREMDRNTTPVYGDGFRMMLPELRRAGSLVDLRQALTGGAPSSRPAPVPAPVPQQIPVQPVNPAQPPPAQPSNPVLIPMRPVPQPAAQAPAAPAARPVIRITSHPGAGPRPAVAATPPTSGRPVIPVRKTDKP